jgi:hypothetical protein
VNSCLRWWLSRRKVGNKLRAARIKLNHNMVTSLPFSMDLMQTFLFKCLLYAFLTSVHRLVSASVTEENNSYIRR